jgi:hypothetical protein
MSKTLLVRGYTCIICKKWFDNKENYDEHSENCAPNLFSMIQNLSLRIDTLEKDNIELKHRISSLKNIETRKGAKEIFEVLKECPKPSIAFKDWVELLLTLVQEKLNVVFENDLLHGINDVLKTGVENIETIPLIVFDRKPNSFYCYDETGNWSLIQISDFDNIIGRISYRFLVEFNRSWYQPNIKKIQESEEYKDLYNNYYIKILGGNRISDESRCQRVRNTLYNLIKHKE